MNIEKFFEKSREIKLETSKKALLKERIFLKVEGNLFAGICLDPCAKVRVKERVFHSIKGMSQPRFWLRRVFLFHKKFVSFATLFVMIFGLFAFVNSTETRVVRADTLTKLDFFSGPVSVKRGDAFIEPYFGMELFERDRIFTGRSGEAVIEYFDDSVTRMRGNSEISIEKLYRQGDSRSRTYVEVELISGAAWSKVVNLVEEASYVMVAGDVYAKTKRAAFNLEVGYDSVEMEVFSSNVQIHRPLVDAEVSTVLSGQKIKVESQKKEIEISHSELSDSQDTWVAQNLLEDQKYVLKVEERTVDEKKKMIADNPESAELSGPSLKENALILLTFDDVRKKQIALDLVEQNFIAAELRLRESDVSKEELQSAQDMISEFSRKVSEYNDFIAQVGVRDEMYAASLKEELEQKLLAYKKDLSGVLPDSQVYYVKETLDALVFDVLKDDSVKIAGLKVDNAYDKLFDAAELLKKGDRVLAGEIMEEYEEDLKLALSVVVELKDPSLENAPVEEDAFYDKKEELFKKIEEAENIRMNIAETVINEDELKQGDYGVEIYGDKPISPLFKTMTPNQEQYSEDPESFQIP